MSKDKKERKKENLKKKSSLKLFCLNGNQRNLNFLFIFYQKNRVDLTEKSESSRYHNISKLVFLMS